MHGYSIHKVLILSILVWIIEEYDVDFISVFINEFNLIDTINNSMLFVVIFATDYYIITDLTIIINKLELIFSQNRFYFSP